VLFCVFSNLKNTKIVAEVILAWWRMVAEVELFIASQALILNHTIQYLASLSSSVMCGNELQ
jgi:hypothetical protein